MAETATRPFQRDSDCPAHDSRCTAALCIIQPAHPQHGEYLQWLEQRAPQPPRGPYREVSNWQETSRGAWDDRRRDTSVWLDGDAIEVRDDEGGGSVPIPVVLEMLATAGYRLVKD